jgi:acyl-CoA reductase-like NAD-dependent aldehyde dehydrogenase
MTDSILPAVREFLAQKPIPHFINGAFVPSKNGASEEVLNPSDGEVLATVAFGGAPEVEAAAQAAHKAFPAWSAMSPNERAVILHRLADRMAKDTAVLAQIESLDVGKAILAAEAFDIPFGTEGLRYFADLSTHAQYTLPLAIKNMEAHVHRAPFGVCGFIFPWNFPFDLLMWGIAPALASGNTVVVKPSEITPLSTLYVAKLAAEAGLPPGVLNVVTGDGPGAGSPLAQHPLVRRMSFTGSPEVGARIGEVCGRRIIPCKLELGGKGAAVVLADADVAGAAAKLADALTLNTGQVCCTATRWLVQDRLFDDFVSAATKALQAVKIGPGLDRETKMGPLVSEKQRERVLGYFDKGIADGGRVLLKGGRGDQPRGFFVKPWLIEGTADNVCYREEIFGPAACVTRFGSDDEAVGLVNRLDYGLANSVWTRDLARAKKVAERLVAGNAWINAHNVFAYGLPYGGINRSGLGGGVNSPATFYDYLRDQTIARPL